MGLKKIIDLDRLSRFKSALDNQIGNINYLVPGSNIVDAINNTYSFAMDLADMWIKPLVLLVIDNDSLVLNMKLGDMAPNVFINYGTDNDLQKLARIYLQGEHLEFYLPHSMLDGGAQDQFVSFRIEDLQTNASTLQITSMVLSATVEGTVYWAALTPVSNYAMLGTLYSREIPTMASDIGAYAKPSGGIPKTDLASDVQTSLGKADTALQQHQSLSAYRTAADQDTIDAAQNTAIAGKLPTTGDAYRAASIPMGQLDSTSTATVMTATIPGITELRDGVCMWLTNGVITSASGFTLNINSLGAKPVYGSLAAATRSTTIFNINYTMLFVYNSTRVDGGCWDVVYGYDSNTNTIGYQLRTNGTTLPMSSVTYRYRLLFTSADGTHFVPANNSTSTNATASRTVCQTPINPHGPIFYYGTTASVAADVNPSGSYLWTRYTVTLGYSFNRTGAALVLSVNKPVYIKAAPQANGSAIIDANTPYVQDLPTTDDGKIYIFLGVTTSATVVELVDVHPIYCNRNGRIQIWTGVEAEIDALKAQIAALDILDEEEF